MIAPNHTAMTNTVAVASTINGAEQGVVQFPITTSLYVGDLDINITDFQLFKMFSTMGFVRSVRVCRDVTTQRSLGYAYVNFSSAADAAKALDKLNFEPLGNKFIRIMYSNRDPSLRLSGAANIFIKNLDKSIDNKLLHRTFSGFGTILSCKVATDAFGLSKGYGFVHYETEEAAKNAIELLNGMVLNGKRVYVGPFRRKQDKENAVDKTKFNNVYVKNLAKSTTKEELKEIFGKYGTITSAVVMTDENGKSRCFGFVNFENPEDAARAVHELNGKIFNGQEWYVGRAQKKSEREMELKAKFYQSAKEAVGKLHGLNLYLKNLDDSISDDQLREIFSQYGTITSCKIMRIENGISKGFGFVAFSTIQEASRALVEMNRKIVAGKPLYVAIAQRKEYRTARLRFEFEQMRRKTMWPPIGHCLPMYYAQALPFVPSQSGFGFRSQMIHGMRPLGPPMLSIIAPFVQPGQ